MTTSLCFHHNRHVHLERSIVIPPAWPAATKSPKHRLWSMMAVSVKQMRGLYCLGPSASVQVPPSRAFLIFTCIRRDGLSISIRASEVEVIVPFFFSLTHFGPVHTCEDWHVSYHQHMRLLNLFKPSQSELWRIASDLVKVALMVLHASAPGRTCVEIRTSEIRSIRYPTSSTIAKIVHRLRHISPHFLTQSLTCILPLKAVGVLGACIGS